MSEVEMWRGELGNEYTKQNLGTGMPGRKILWTDILTQSLMRPKSFLEIGAGNGKNLCALRGMGFKNLFGVEPNKNARDLLSTFGFHTYDGTAINPYCTADLVFTSGVLIHIPPDELLAACQGIYDAAERYIVCIEYFSDEPETKPYRGRHLWKRDFGDFWMENFDLQPLGCGFAWKRTTGLDNLTWWTFAK
ncbi:hypothetical protein LCGC14_0612000 [marine sediment metagenome]|uniref:Methyltransferase domain-containing protein n=1 Tax=marine sediment metagenome TaxID=412755 RepID=A0A0F9TTQ6_9ZZZZ